MIQAFAILRILIFVGFIGLCAWLLLSVDEQFRTMFWPGANLGKFGLVVFRSVLVAGMIGFLYAIYKIITVTLFARK